MFTNVLFYGSNKSSRVSRVFSLLLLAASFGAWRVALSRDIGALLLRERPICPLMVQKCSHLLNYHMLLTSLLAIWSQRWQ